MKIGQYVHISFLDHSQYSGDAKGPIPLEVCGLIVGLSKESVEISSFYNAKDLFDGNNVTFSILLSTIKKIKRLK